MIIAAAVEADDGRIFVGCRHSEIYDREPDSKDGLTCYLTDNGDVLGSGDALDHGLACGQFTTEQVNKFDNTYELLSNDLPRSDVNLELAQKIAAALNEKIAEKAAANPESKPQMPRKKSQLPSEVAQFRDQKGPQSVVWIMPDGSTSNSI